MSNNNEEETNIFLTNKGFKEVFNKLKELANKREDFLYESALSFYDYFKLKKINTYDEVLEAFENWDSRGGINCSLISRKDTLSYDDAFNRIVREMFRNDKNKLLKPRKSSFQYIKNTSKVIDIDVNFGNIFAAENKVLLKCYRNNKAVDDFNNDKIVHEFKRFLDKEYNWKRSEGGVTKYKDEFQDEFSGGVITNLYGPLGIKLADEHEGNTSFRRKFKNNGPK